MQVFIVFQSSYRLEELEIAKPRYRELERKHQKIFDYFFAIILCLSSAQAISFIAFTIFDDDDGDEDQKAKEMDFLNQMTLV